MVQICPICGGSGQVHESRQEGSSYAGGMKTCHGCGGKGWIQTQCDCPYQQYPVDPMYPYVPFNPPRPYPWTGITWSGNMNHYTGGYRG
jgi:hypothetical protein